MSKNIWIEYTNEKKYSSIKEFLIFSFITIPWVLIFWVGLIYLIK